MPNNLIKVQSHTGIYYIEAKKKRYRGKPDRCFYTTYQNKSKKIVREKVGWISEGYTTQMAIHIRAERKRKIRHGKELPDRRKTELTLAQTWKRYDDWLDTGKKHVYDDRNRYKNHIKPKFASNGLSEISTHDLEKFKDQLLKKGLSPATTKHVLVLIRQIYNKAITWKLWEGTPPTKGLKMPQLNNKRVRFFTHEQASELLAAVKKKSVTQYELGTISLHTGMRADEVFSMLWGHIDTERGIIHVADPKGGPARDAYMTETAKQLFDSKDRGEAHELVFKNRDGNKFGEVSKTWLRTIRDLGYNKGIEDRRQIVSFHTLRHTYASWLAMQGTPILEIKELLGYATLAMTERYARLIPDTKRKTVARFEEAIKAADQPDQENQSSEPNNSDSNDSDRQEDKESSDPT